jgi:hypothetical protein
MLTHAGWPNASRANGAQAPRKRRASGAAPTARQASAERACAVLEVALVPALRITGMAGFVAPPPGPGPAAPGPGPGAGPPAGPGGMELAMGWAAADGLLRARGAAGAAEAAAALADAAADAAAAAAEAAAGGAAEEDGAAEVEEVRPAGWILGPARPGPARPGLMRRARGLGPVGAVPRMGLAACPLPLPRLLLLLLLLLPLLPLLPLLLLLPLLPLLQLLPLLPLLPLLQLLPLLPLLQLLPLLLLNQQRQAAQCLETLCLRPPTAGPWHQRLGGGVQQHSSSIDTVLLASPSAAA